MADKKQEPKQLFEREYIVPLRKGWLKVPKYKRATKAVKTLKQFMARHMKVYDRDLKKVKIDIILNNEIRFRGMKKPPAKIKVRARKFDDGIVKVELVNIPKHIEFARLREKKNLEKTEKIKKPKEKIEEIKKEEKVGEEKIEEIKKEDKNETEDEKKKEGGELEKLKTKIKVPKFREKHISEVKKTSFHRVALEK